MSVLTEEQQGIADSLVELERRGALADRPDLQDGLRVMRQRGLVPANPFTLADTSPVDFEVAPAFQPSNRKNLPPGTLQAFEERQARAETGQREDPLEVGDNFKLGLSLHPNAELKTILDERFDADVPIRFDPNTQRYQYLSPEDNRIVNVGITGPDMGDVTRFSGEAPVVVGDVVGSVGGGIAGAAITRTPTGAVAGESIGSATMTYVGEMIRLGMGKLAGVNQDVTLEQMHESALKKGAFAGGATAVAGGTMSTAKALWNFVQGRTATKEAALRSGLQSQEADAAIAHVNKLLENTGESVKVTTAKRSNDPALLADEAVVRREKEFVREFVERDASDERALLTAFDEISPVSEVGGEGVVRKFGADRRARMDTVDNALEQSRETLQDHLDAIGPSIIDDTGASVRGAISEKRTAVNNSVKRVNGAWLKFAGANKDQTASQFQVPVGPETRKLMAALNQESRNAIVRVTKQDRAGVFVKKTADELTEGEKRALEVRKTILGDEFVDDFAGASTSHDLIDYQRAISDLRSTIRSADRNESVSKGQVTVMKRAVKALVRDRDKMLRLSGRDDLFFAIKSADVYTRQARDMLDRSIAGDLMVKTGNRFKVRSQDIFDKAFVKGGKEESEELYAVIGGNQPAVQAWRAEILNKYKNTVFPEDKTTKASVKAHRQFMSDYGDAMSPFFSKTEMAQMNKLGGLVKVVEKQEAQAKRILDTLNKKGTVKAAEGRRVVAETRQKLATLEPEQVAPWIVRNKDTGPARARRVVQLLGPKTKMVDGVPVKQTGTTPVLEGIRGEVRLNMRNEVAPDGIINASAFDNHIRNHAASYRELFGQKYVDDLFEINKVLKIAERRGAPTSQGESLQIPVQIARGTIARPLSPEGRLLTAAMLFKSRAGKRAIARSLLNPEDLSALAELSVLNPNTRRAGELAASLGILEYTNEDLGDK